MTDRTDVSVALRRIARLEYRKERDAAGLFVAEGIRFASEALAGHADVDFLLTCPPLLTNPHGRKVVQTFRSRGAPVLETTPDQYLSLSRAEIPQGVILAVRQRWDRLPQAQRGAQSCWLALDQVNSGGNLGTMLRTCDAAGAEGIILLGPRADPYDPSAVRASMGAIFSRRLIRTNWQEFAAWRRRSGVTSIGTSAHAERDYRTLDYRNPVVLLMGCEQRGLSEEQRAHADVLVRIPMAGRADSLNLGAATAVLLYEIYRQRNPPAPQRETTGGRQCRDRPLNTANTPSREATRHNGWEERKAHARGRGAAPQPAAHRGG